MSGKKTTVIITLSFDTNNDVVQMLADRNKEYSKQSKGFVTKSQLLSEIVEEHFNTLRMNAQ